MLQLIKKKLPLSLHGSRVTANIFQFPGVLSYNWLQLLKAEIRPVEPDQGNACAGKVVRLFYSTLRFRSISLNSSFSTQMSNMKKMFLGICYLLLTEAMLAQTLRGRVIDDRSGAPIAAATIELENFPASIASDSGFF